MPNYGIGQYMGMKGSVNPAQGKGRGGYWVAVLFGLVFFCIGAGFLVFGVLPNLRDALRMQDWVPVPAEVLEVELEAHDSDDATTYKVRARFRYEYRGVPYTGNRVGIADGGSDNIGDWQRDTYNRLRASSRTTLWVNPDRPSESIYDRELRWGLLGFKLIFVVVFGGFGAGFLWYLNRRQKPVPPGLPAWQAKPEWRDNRIRSSARQTLWLAWGFALFWNVLTSPLLFILPEELAKGNYPALLGLLFPLVGLGLLYWAIRRTLNWRRFGITLLEMDPFPGAIGGDVGGAVELRLRYNPKHEFRVTLTCVHARRRRTSDGTETVRDARWQDEQAALVEPGLHGTRLRFLFRPPGDLPESSGGEDSWYEWNLQISAGLPGTDFDRDWKIPVFRDAGPQTARNPVRPRAPGASPTGLIDKVVQVRETGDGITLYYPCLRNPGMAFSTLVTGLCFAGFAWLVHSLAKGEDFPMLFVGLFALIGLSLVFWGIYLLGNSLQVRAGRRGLDVVRRVFGLRLTRHAAAGEIASIEKTIGMQMRQGSHSQAFYRIQVHTTDGRYISVGSGITGASNAEAVMARLRAALGLPEETADVAMNESRAVV